MKIRIGAFRRKAFRKKNGMVIIEKQTEEAERELVFEGKYVFLQKMLNCDEKHAVAIAEKFEKVTGEKLKEAKIIPDEKKTRLLKVSSEKKDYYLRITAGNMLREIREGQKQGQILYQIIY